MKFKKVKANEIKTAISDFSGVERYLKERLGMWCDVDVNDLKNNPDLVAEVIEKLSNDAEFLSEILFNVIGLDLETILNKISE